MIISPARLVPTFRVPVAVRVTGSKVAPPLSRSTSTGPLPPGAPRWSATVVMEPTHAASAVTANVTVPSLFTSKSDSPVAPGATTVVSEAPESGARTRACGETGP